MNRHLINRIAFWEMIILGGETGLLLAWLIIKTFPLYFNL